MTVAEDRHSFDEALEAFAADVGAAGPVCVRGGGTRWNLGGEVAPGTREVRAPSGIVAFEPAEMTVRVRAGTPVAELHEALAAAAQRTSLPERPGSTVGGALMAGESSTARLGLGPVRDALLQARYVSAEGQLSSAGAATVKNVSGFDLCRLLVGSLGTLGLVGEALLRTLPVGEVERWARLDGADPQAVHSACPTAMSILWDGASVWVLLGGYGVDVDEDLARLAASGSAPPADVDGPPDLPPHRWSCTPAEAASFAERAHGPFVAEIGVGVVHACEPQPSRLVADGVVLVSEPQPSRLVADGVVLVSEPQPSRLVADGVVALNRRFKERFDPSGRLNPGRDPLRRP